MAKTSLIIDNYNNGPYLRACVDSALNQTVPADEIIVYDDGSSDDSLAILKSYGDRIRLIAGTHLPLTHRAAQTRAVQAAFAESSGDLVFLLDGDDRFHPRKIEVYLATFAAHPGLSLIQSPMVEIDSRDAVIGDNRRNFKHQADYLAATYDWNDVDFYYPTSSLAFSREFLKQVLSSDYPQKTGLAIDTLLSCLAPLYGPVICLDDCLSDWRRHTRSVSVRYWESRAFLLKETMRRTRHFNAFCKQRGFKPISLWKNRRFYRHLLRAAFPGFVFDFYQNHLRRKEAQPTLAH